MRFDHVQWVVPDIEAAAHQLREKFGFFLSEKGGHPQFGTVNYCIHFQLQYVELIQAVDLVKALSSSSPFVGPLVNLQKDGGGLLTFALAHCDVEGLALSLQRRGYDVGSPKQSSRLRPDGTCVRWKMFFLPTPPDGSTPFLIEWEDSDKQRMEHLKTAGFIGEHATAGLSFAHLGIAVRDLDRHLSYYREILGLEPERPVFDEELQASCVDLPLENGGLRLLCPADTRPDRDGPVSAHLSFRGESPMMIVLRASERNADMEGTPTKGRTITSMSSVTPAVWLRIL